MMFVKTTSDLRLFDSRAVKLFEIVEEPSETDVDRGDGDADDADPGTDVDEEYYQEAFFPGEGEDSQSDPEEPGGFLYAGAGGGGSGEETSVAGSEVDGRADSLV
ncbi:unnamed protein product [Scytosiphon promiscuus]